MCGFVKEVGQLNDDHNNTRQSHFFYFETLRQTHQQFYTNALFSLLSVAELEPVTRTKYYWFEN